MQLVPLTTSQVASVASKDAGPGLAARPVCPPAKTGTRVTLATNWMTCVPSQDAGPGLASQVSRDKPVGAPPCQIVIEMNKQ